MVKNISAVKSALMFNQRVLNLGTVDSNLQYTMEELKQKLFFNKIFRSNSAELFRKNDCSDIVNEYLNSFQISHRNLVTLCHKIMETDSSVRIDFDDSFERRLITETRIRNQLSSRYVNPDELRLTGFLDSQLYYVSVSDNMLVVSSADPQKALYDKPLSYNYREYTKYWKTDDCVRSYLEKIFGPTVTISVITRNTRIVMVEYDGNVKVAESIIKYFPADAAVYHNPYLYLDDLEQIVTAHTKQNSQPITDQPSYPVFELSDLMHNDMIVEYPKVSFDAYLRFIHLASLDPTVKTISMCLYRIGNNPIIFYILRDAVRRGKIVTVNIEMQASGEDINRFWLTEMRTAGIDVTTYANGYLKVHSKLSLITFNDGTAIAQIGTGNYHCQTTSSYTDISYFTSDPKTCGSVFKLFSVLSQDSSEDITFDSCFLVTGYNARNELAKRISEQAQLGKDGYIVMKCNSLDDPDINQQLELAAETGCTVELVVRGICTWDPGDYLGSNVRIRSFVWDKLEHSRVYRFGRDNPICYLGSLDPVSNKLDRRIETMVQVSSNNSIQSVCNYLKRYTVQNQDAWEMYHSDTGDILYHREKG